MRCRQLGTLALVLAGSTMAFNVSVAPAAELQKETVYIIPGNTMPFLGLAADATGNPHIAFADRLMDNLLYGAKSGGVWAVEIVDTTGNRGDCDIAIDGLGALHIVYSTEVPVQALKYATKLIGGGSWTIETIESGAAEYGQVSLVADGAGVPRVTYFGQGIRYADRLGGSWTNEQIPACGGTVDPAITVDGSNNPIISLHGGVPGTCGNNLLVWTKSGGNWTVATVDSIGGGSYSSIVWRPFGDATYVSYVTGSLKLAIKTSGSWSTETVPGTAGIGPGAVGTSIVVDSQHQPHILYRAVGFTGHAFKNTMGTWVLENIEDGSSVAVSLDVDTFDKLHFGYSKFGAGGGELRYATPGPVCQVEPASIVFDTTFVGDVIDTTLTIKNIGTGILSGTVSISCNHYSLVSGGGPYNLGEGDSVDVTVRFEPVAVGTHLCTLETGDILCEDVALSGVAVPQPTCDVIPTAIDFGDVAIGEAKDADFTVTNNLLSSMNGDISESCDHYSIVSGGGAYSLQDGDSLVVTVRFEPTIEGTHVCTIETGHASCDDVFLVGVGVQCIAAPPNLVSWWPLDENTGSTANDIVSNLNGTHNNGPTPISGKVGVALELNGTNQYVSVPPGPELEISGDVTVDCWIRFDGELRSQYIVSKGGEANGGSDVPQSYQMSMTGDGRLEGGFELSGGFNRFLSDPNPFPTDNEWHFVVYRRAGTTHQLYVDSVVVASVVFSGTPGSTTTLPFNIGTLWHEGAPNRLFAGAIDEVEIYDRALDPAEILAIYNASGGGKCKTLTAIDEPALASRLVLYQNYPNPFNPTTRIRYDLPAYQHVSLRIYDVGGRLVRTLVDGPQGPGEGQAVWDGLSDRGDSVASGVYFYRLTTGTRSQARRMVLLK